MKWKKKCKKILFMSLLPVIFLSACSFQGKKYSYNNLTNEQSITELYEALSSHAVPSEDTDSLIGFVRAYSRGRYAENNLQGSWKNATIKETLYDYTKAINSYGESPFEDLNCREAAFLVFHSFLKAPDSSVKDVTMEEIFFGTFDAGQSVADAVKGYWKSQNIEFAGSDIHLVSLWGKKDDEITNLHCGVLLENEGKPYLLEKVDPILPYQLSIFDAAEDIKAYLLNRTDEYEDMTVFVDDEPI